MFLPRITFSMYSVELGMHGATFCDIESNVLGC